MIEYGVFYPYDEGKRFDLDYYLHRHLPMVRARLGDACKGMVVKAGISGLELGSPPTYIATGHLYFESVEAYKAAFTPHLSEFRADIPNYTDIQPVRQISEVSLINSPG